MATSASDDLKTRVANELDATLKLIDDTQRRSVRAIIPGPVWLRAARGCWLLAEMDWSANFYKRAAISILQSAQDDGRRQGFYAPLALLAIGAAWMSGDRDLLATTGSTIDEACRSLIANTDLNPEPLVAASLHLTRIRVAWFQGRGESIQRLMPDLERAVRGLDKWGEWYWEAERDIHTHTVFHTLLAQKPDPIKACIQKYNEYLVAQQAKSPTITELVDEEFISFASAVQDLGIELARVTLPIVPGKL